MKKGLVLLFIVILLCGCQKKEDAKKELEVLASNYYEKYASGKVVGLDTLEITLGDIRNLNDKDLDTSSLKSYSDDTKITATIENNQLTNYQIDLKK